MVLAIFVWVLIYNIFIYSILLRKLLITPNFSTQFLLPPPPASPLQSSFPSLPLPFLAFPYLPLPSLTFPFLAANAFHQFSSRSLSSLFCWFLLLCSSCTVSSTSVSLDGNIVGLRWLTSRLPSLFFPIFHRLTHASAPPQSRISFFHFVICLQRHSVTPV